MPAIYANVVSGTLTDSPLLIGATSANSSNFASLPTVTAPDFLWLTLDPLGTAGAPEIVKVTAHTAASTTVTITRAQQSTTARQHLVSTAWDHAVTADDMRPGAVSYAQTTADELAIAGDVTGLTTTFTAVAGRRYKVTARVGNQGGYCRLKLLEGATVLTEAIHTNAGPGMVTTTLLEHVSNASISGSKTWKLNATNDNGVGGGSGTLDVIGSATTPNFILVEDIGAI